MVVVGTVVFSWYDESYEPGDPQCFRTGVRHRQRQRALTGAHLRDIAIIRNGAVVIEDAEITWVGSTEDLPPLTADADILDATGKVVLPGFVDSHTHLLFAGSREDEFEARLRGLSYQQIAGQWRRHQRDCEASARVVTLAARRTGTQTTRAISLIRRHDCRVKSGYGLTLADEMKSLEAIAELNAAGPLELVPTFLGAHAVPAEYSERSCRLSAPGSRGHAASRGTLRPGGVL